jgi:hypothetical protein
MLNGTVDKRPFAENDRGTGPASSVSPASSAIQGTGEFWHSPPEGLEPEDHGAAFEIQQEFRRRMQGLRGLSRRERAVAYRAAKAWYREALATLREKQSRERRAAWLIRRNRIRRCRFIPPCPRF